WLIPFIPIGIVLLGGAGWLLRHRWFGGALVQRTSVSHTATQMLTLMKQNGIAFEEIQAMEAYLEGKSDAALNITDAPSSKAEAAPIPELSPRDHVSAYLGAKADAALAVAEATLQETELTLGMILSAEDRVALGRAQEAFRTYRGLQSEFASSLVHG